MRARYVFCAALVLAHVAVVLSIVRQPLAVNAAPLDRRAWIWPLHHDTVHRIGPGADFFALYHAGVASGQGLSPYEDAESPAITPYFFPYRYLPGLAATLGRGITLLPPRTAYLVWIGVLEGLLAALVWRVRHLGSAAALLLSTPYFLEVHAGQFTFATCALVVLALLGGARPGGASRPGWGAASLLAGAAFLKIFPVVAAPAFLRRRPERVLAGAVVVAVAGGLLPFLWSPGWAPFRDANFAAGTAGMDGGNHGLARLIFVAGEDLGVRWTGQSWDIPVAWARGIVLGATAVAVWLSRGASRLDRVVVLLLAHFLTYSQVWEHHSSGVVVLGSATLWGLAGAGCRAPAWERRATGGALVLLALPTPFFLLGVVPDPAVWDPTPLWPHWGLYALPLSKALPTLALYLLGMRRVWKGCGGDTPSAPPAATVRVAASEEPNRALSWKGRQAPYSNLMEVRPAMSCDLCASSSQSVLCAPRPAQAGVFAVVRCLNCDLLFLDHFPSEAELQKQYDEDYFNSPAPLEGGYEDYLKDEPQIKRTFERHLELLPDPIRLHSNGHLLDVGCATGVFLQLMQDKGWTVRGLDVAPFAVGICQQRQLSVENTNLLAARLPDSSFDLISMWDVIEHISSPRVIFRECHRLLKPGGCLVLTTPDSGALLARLSGRYWLGFRSVGEHLYFFDRTTMRRYLAESGFADATFHATGKFLALDRLITRLCFYTRIFRLLRAVQYVLPEWISVYVNSGDTMHVSAIKPASK